MVLNHIAHSIIESVSGEHSAYVFAWINRKGRRQWLERLTSSGRRATRRGQRLRPAGAELRDRQDFLGHKSGCMTTHYSAAEMGNLLAAVNRIANSRQSPAGTVLRLVGER